MQVYTNVLFGNKNSALKKKVDNRLKDKSHLVPKGALTLPQKAPKKERKLLIAEIPPFAILSRIKFIDKSKRVEAQLEPKDIKRAVMINDSDFLTFSTPSLQYIKGVHPNVPLRTDEFVVKDTKINPIVPDTSGDLVFPENSLEFDQVNALYHASETKDMINNYWGIEVPWAFKGPIRLDAHARFYNQGTGEYSETWDNAFYSRQYKEIALLIAKNKREEGYVYASRSADTIAHETSHAKLDGLETYYGDSKCFRTIALHEAFADFNAMLHSLQSNKILDKVLKDTKGDLRKENLVSMFDIQFGRKVLEKERPCLRSAINTFKKPDNFSELRFVSADRNEFVIEPHTYSQLLTGTLYDSLVGIYEKNLDTYKDQKVSLLKAKDTIGSIFNRSFLYLPAAEVDFKDVALAMLTADKIEHNGENFEVLTNIFKDRKILDDLDIKRYETQQAKIKPFTLPAEELLAQQYEALLEEHKADIGITTDKSFKFHKKFVDFNGNVFLKFTHNHNLVIPQERDKYFIMSGDKIPVKDGITLAFNSDGVLTGVLSKELSSKDKSDILVMFEKYADYKYRPLQEGYDEVAEEWEAELKRREEARRKKAEQAKKDPDQPTIPKSTIHRYHI